jgi:DNA polymerase-3 subunit alpha (Gram-positive type)
MTTTYLAFDLETTGLSPMSDRILEIGAVLVEEEEVTDTFETFIDVGIPVPAHITKLTGITGEMIAGSPGVREAVTRFLEFSGDRVILGHNLQFDYSFMKRNVVNMGLSYERQGLDTLKIARLCLPELESRSLDRLAAYFGIPEEHHHRALDDALTTARLYERLKEEFGEKRPDLFEPSPMTFKVKKESPVTNSQKRYLRDLIKYHKIEDSVKIEELTKNEASRMIDGIILQYGRIIR